MRTKVISGRYVLVLAAIGFGLVQLVHEGSMNGRGVIERTLVGEEVRSYATTPAGGRVEVGREDKSLVGVCSSEVSLRGSDGALVMRDRNGDGWITLGSNVFIRKC